MPAKVLKLFRPPYRWRHFILIAVVGLANALTFVFLVPPWQHYDEPKHFEYVWWVANHGEKPQKNDFDASFSREVINSMVTHYFWGDEDATYLLERPDNEMIIPGLRQVDEPLAYYLWASLPLRWMEDASVESQLIAARLMSVLLYLGILVVAWGVMKELVSADNPLRWLVPLSLALIPGFVDIMTAVNNDVAAVLGFTFFLWSVAALLKRPLKMLNILWALLSAVACVFLKSTASFAVLLLPVALLFASLGKQRQAVAWVVLALTALLGVGLTLRWDDAMFWHRTTAQETPIRQKDPQAVSGEYVLTLETNEDVIPKWSSPVYQLIPQNEWGEFVTQKVTLGAWVWANKPVEINFISFVVPYKVQSHSVNVSTQPQFFAFLMEGLAERKRVWIEIDPGRELGDIAVYFDDFVLLPGEFPLEGPPVFDSLYAERGVWGGIPFVNRIRNASLEKAGPRIHPAVDNLAASYLPDNTKPSILLTSLFDLKSSGYLYRITFVHLFRTFWGRFGWGHVPLLPLKVFRYRPYRLLGYLSLLALFGVLLTGIWNRKRIRWDLVFIFGLSMVILWGITLLRGTVFLPLPKLYFSVARHALPAVLPTVLFLLQGWLEIARLLRNLFQQLGDRLSLNWLPGDIRPLLLGLYWSFFLGLNIYSYVSILSFYKSG